MIELLKNNDRKITTVLLSDIINHSCKYCNTGKYKDQLGVIPKFKYCPMCGRKLGEQNERVESKRYFN